MEQQRQYVGIDLHRQHSVIVRITEQGEVLETVRVGKRPTPAGAHTMADAGQDPEVVLEAAYGWVRHEAPHDRVGGKSPTSGLSQQAAEAGGSLTSETRGRAGAASTTPGRTGTTRQLGPGKQDGEVYVCRNQWWNPLKNSGPAGNRVDGRDGSALNFPTTGRNGLDAEGRRAPR